MIDSTFGPSFLHYLDHSQLGERTARIWIPLTVTGTTTLEIPAILDTAADWSIVGWDTAQALGLPLGTGERVSYSTRLGRFEGELIRHTLQLRSRNADEGPPSLDIEATIWVCENWTGHCFIGYNGFLDRIRFAVDPVEKVFFFGRSA